MSNTPSPFIDSLVAELEPVRPMRPSAGIVRAGLAAAATLAVLVATVGLRPDIMQGELHTTHLLSCGLIAVLAVASTYAVIDMARPQMGQNRTGWIWATAMAGLLPATALVTSALQYGRTGNVAMDGDGWACMVMGVALGVFTATALTLWLRRGAPSRPALAGWLTGLASGSVGMFVFSLYCPHNDIGHIGLWHGLSVGFSALLGRMLVPRLIRW